MLRLLPTLPSAALRAAVLVAVCTAPALTAARTMHDESLHGDLANSGLTPTLLNLAPGSNLLLGTTGRLAGVIDRDYFSFTLPAGWQLDTIMVLPGTQGIGTSQLSFIAVQAGTQVTVSPTANNPAGLLGYWHFGENDVGGDILGVMGVAQGAQGFGAPLPAGSYAFWIQDSATGTATYRMDFNVSAVPEPPPLALLAAGLCALGLLQARPRQHR